MKEDVCVEVIGSPSNLPKPHFEGDRLIGNPISQDQIEFKHPCLHSAVKTMRFSIWTKMGNDAKVGNDIAEKDDIKLENNQCNAGAFEIGFVYLKYLRPVFCEEESA